MLFWRGMIFWIRAVEGNVLFIFLSFYFEFSRVMLDNNLDNNLYYIIFFLRLQFSYSPDNCNSLETFLPTESQQT